MRRKLSWRWQQCCQIRQRRGRAKLAHGTTPSAFSSALAASHALKLCGQSLAARRKRRVASSFNPLVNESSPLKKIASQALLLGGVRIVCGSKYSSRRHLVHEQSDDRRRPDGHVELGTGLR